MMSGRGTCLPENMLGLSWHDNAWIPILNPSNVLDYFSERSNPFYDRTCNNEIIKMQRLNPEQLVNMTGVEYMLLHVQEPILYVVRKLHRHSPTQITPLADYYIIAGTVYQAPDLASVIGARLLTSVTNLQSALDRVFHMTRYHPSTGYTWDMKTRLTLKPKVVKKEKVEEPGTLFQRQRTDMLLAELSRRWPLPPVVAPTLQSEAPVSEADIVKQEPKEEIKEEPREEKQDAPLSPSSNPPPEKKPKLNSPEPSKS